MEARTMSRGARVPHLVGSRLSSPYHFRARIQSFQAVAAPFPGDSFAASLSRRDPGDRNASPQKIDNRLAGVVLQTELKRPRGGGLKNSKTTIASFSVLRKKNRHRQVDGILPFENRAWAKSSPHRDCRP